jgi:hypothetical protein
MDVSIKKQGRAPTNNQRFLGDLYLSVEENHSSRCKKKMGINCSIPQSTTSGLMVCGAQIGVYTCYKNTNRHPRQ